MKRTVPATMATQHPDNAGKPYWHHGPFVSSLAEIKESYLCFSDLGIDEYNWDWEGKFVDEAVVDRLLNQHYSYFSRNPLGRDKFLTFRFPNPRVEKQFRLARALMVAITSSQLAKSLSLRHDPVFEAILPLTESATEIMEIQEAFKSLVGIEHRLLKLNQFIKHIMIIPLFEQVSTIIGSDKIIREYVSLHEDEFGAKPEYLRPYIARSDPALNSGLIPTMIAAKIALNKYRTLESELEVPLFPMIGTGSLPFRGGLTPDSIDKNLDEYAGIRTLVIQSAFRYDYPRKAVKEAVKKIKTGLKRRPVKLTAQEISDLVSLLPDFEKPYRDTVEKISSLINQVSLHVAKRRERMLHIGLFGYSRGVGKVQLPRAITFTASLYSVGIPPEFIGSGRGLESARKKGRLDDIKKTYLYMAQDLLLAGRYLNKDNLAKLAAGDSAWQEVADDVDKAEKILRVEFGPKTSTDREYQNLTSRILEKSKSNQNISQLITITGRMRKSLG